MLRIALRESRGSLLGWSIGLGLLLVITIASFPAIKGNEEYDQLWQELPESARELFGGAASISTFPGFLDSQFLSILPVLAGIFATMHASRTLAGEEEQGRLDLLLSTPLSRRRLVLASGFAVLLAQVLFFAALAAVGVLAALAIGETEDLWRLPLAVLDGLPAAWAFGMVTFLAGAVVHRRSLAIMVGTVFLAGSYFLGALAAQVEFLAPLRWGSIMFHYGRSDWYGDGPDPGYLLFGLLLSAACFAASVAVFRRKDLTG